MIRRSKIPRTRVGSRPRRTRTSPRAASHAGIPGQIRRFPIGAEVIATGGTHFRVWAPRSKSVAVQLANSPDLRTAATFDLDYEPGGYFSGVVAPAKAGMFYKFAVDSGDFPDPASRFQPAGPHGPSQIIDSNAFDWTDIGWKGVPREGQVIYELHVGTFTPEGTYQAATDQLPELAGLGITVIELMPLADFPGRFGWGYDGVDLFAPTRLYGSPDDLRSFVNRAHELGLGVILDVVYNHLGPDGNYLKEFSTAYFTDRHQNEWGEAINFDGPHSGPVREFFTTNAAYWIDEFHFDGLRLDATQQIFDDSEDHILAAITRAVRHAGGERATYLVAENECQHTEIVRAADRGGYGLDALWNDDFHHSALVAATGRREAYYSDYHGTPQELVSAMKWGYLFQGQWYDWQKKGRGHPGLDLHPANFVNCIENHDQVSNSLRGTRLHQLTSPGRYKALTALLLLGPGTPMLFQGQEFAAAAPFVYFADHNPELAKLVTVGRRKFLEQFPSNRCPETGGCLPDPESEATFNLCKLDFSERERHSSHYSLHRDLLKLRRTDAVFSHPQPRGVDGTVLGPEAFALRFFGEAGDDRLMLVNLGCDLILNSIPDPLIAPPAGSDWKLIWSSEEPRYGGSGTPPIENEGWRIPGHAAVVLAVRTKA